MSNPTIKSGRFHAGTDLQCGENVVIDVAEEVVVGDRCVLSDNAYLGGRKITIGDDFYSFSWGHPSNAFQPPQYELSRGWLEVGRGRRDDEDAVLQVGHRCVFHDNRIDLSRRVMIGSDVGLSPEVTIYTHGYWMSPFDGFPCHYKPVEIGSKSIIGYRSVLVPGASVGVAVVVGAQSVVVGELESFCLYAGNPARKIKDFVEPSEEENERRAAALVVEYNRSCEYRGIGREAELDYPVVLFNGLVVNLETGTCEGDEDYHTDDFRDFLFKRGLRFYTKRPFHKLPIQALALPGAPIKRSKR